MCQRLYLGFVAGEQRWVARDGEVGFHRSHIPGTAFSLVPTETDHRLGRWYAEQGVSKRLIDRPLDTPADEIWHPKWTFCSLMGWRLMFGRENYFSER